MSASCAGAGLPVSCVLRAYRRPCSTVQNIRLPQQAYHLLRPAALPCNRRSSSFPSPGADQFVGRESGAGHHQPQSPRDRLPVAVRQVAAAARVYDFDARVLVLASANPALAAGAHAKEYWQSSAGSSSAGLSPNAFAVATGPTVTVAKTAIAIGLLMSRLLGFQVWNRFIRGIRWAVRPRLPSASGLTPDNRPSSSFSRPPRLNRRLGYRTTFAAGRRSKRAWSCRANKPLRPDWSAATTSPDTLPR